MTRYNVAVVGATGAVGQEMIRILEQREFPVARLLPLASERSAGKSIGWRDTEIIVENLGDASFSGIDFALFSAGAAVSRQFAGAAARSGAVVIDNSSAFRMDEDVPLIVPEVNPAAAFTHKGIIANPNCSTIQMVVVLKPIHDRVRIKRIVVSTYQSVSGTGKEAIDELLSQSRALLDGNASEHHVYPHQIAFNALPHIDDFMEDGYTKEEHKMVDETKKIFGDSSIRITATTVRVPVLIGHSESVNIEMAEPLSAQKARELLRDAPGVKVIDEPYAAAYPLAIDAAGTDPCYVGRIRQDNTVAHGLNLWIVADNLRKGAALNAVQIVELLVGSS